MKHRTIAYALAFGLAFAVGASHAQAPAFEIKRFEIGGNKILDRAELETLVAPYLGAGRGFGDIQKALEAIENAYRRRGYGAVNVHVPEQEVADGVVRLVVVEAQLGAVSIGGNRHFGEANLRAALPGLKEGSPPNLNKISENVQLANENPAKQVEVTLATGNAPGVVDARLKVVEHDPRRIFVTLDNTGTRDTGRHRLGIAWQDANLLGGDEVLTLAYTGSPDVWLGHPDDVSVDVFSLAFRKPFYGLGDSLEVIYGNSNVNVPSVQNTGFGLSGKGEVFALRWNSHFPRRGEYSSKLVYGWDIKHLDTRCTPDQNGINPSCTPYTVRPLSVSYEATVRGATAQWDYRLGLAWNALPTGSRFNHVGTGRTDRYSFIANRQVDDDFHALRFGGSYAARVEGWMLRGAVQGQLAGSGLPLSEQLGLAGTTAVRGFQERAIVADGGHVANLEVYTPNLAGPLGARGNLHALAFYDFAYGRNSGGAVVPFHTIRIASAGLGLRYQIGRDVSFTLDSARIVDPGPPGLEKQQRGDWRTHFKLTVGF